MINPKIIIDNPRDERVVRWLYQEFEPNFIDNAIENIVGQRKPYVSNVCKSLGVVPPDDLMPTDKATAQKYLAKIKKMIEK